jgi:hypothetical protein
MLPSETQATGSEVAVLKQRALVAEQEAAALQQDKLEAQAASAAAQKAQKVSGLLLFCPAESKHAAQVACGSDCTHL